MKIVRAAVAVTGQQGMSTLATCVYIYKLKKIYSLFNTLDNEVKVKMIRSLSNVLPGFNPSPFKVYHIDPGEITHVSGLSPPRLYGASCGGDWDRIFEYSSEYYPYKQKSPINDTLAYRGMRDYILEGNTELLFKHFENHITNPESRPWGHDSIDEFDDRLGEIDELYTSIRDQGYLTQRELLETNDETVRNKNNELVPPELNEVVIDIGRDGEPLHAGPGTHRLAIAKLIGIDKIPVIVAARHKKLSSDPTILK